MKSYILQFLEEKSDLHQNLQNAVKTERGMQEFIEEGGIEALVQCVSGTERFSFTDMSKLAGIKETEKRRARKGRRGR